MQVAIARSLGSLLNDKVQHDQRVDGPKPAIIPQGHSVCNIHCNNRATIRHNVLTLQKDIRSTIEQDMNNK